jgi:hypothetical protein
MVANIERLVLLPCKHKLNKCPSYCYSIVIPAYAIHGIFEQCIVEDASIVPKGDNLAHDGLGELGVALDCDISASSGIVATSSRCI